MENISTNYKLIDNLDFLKTDNLIDVLKKIKNKTHNIKIQNQKLYEQFIKVFNNNEIFKKLNNVNKLKAFIETILIDINPALASSQNLEFTISLTKFYDGLFNN